MKRKLLLTLAVLLVIGKAKAQTDRWIFPLVFTDATNNPDTVWFVQYDSTMVTLNAILEEEGINPNVDTTNFCVYFEDGLGNKTKISAKPFGTNFEEVRIDAKNIEFPIRTNWDRNIVNSPCEPYGAIQFSQITGEYFGMFDINGYQYDDVYDLWDNIFQNADSTGLQPAVVYNNEIEIGDEEEWVLNNYFPMYITLSRVHQHNGYLSYFHATVEGHTVMLDWAYTGCDHVSYYYVARQPVQGGTSSYNTTTETAFTEYDVPAGKYYYELNGLYPNGAYINPDVLQTYGIYVEVLEDPISNLQANINGNNVTLTWDTPRLYENYGICRDEVLIGNTTDNSYTDYNVPDGNHTYLVVVYDSDETPSFTASLEITIDGIVENYIVVNAYPNPASEIVNIEYLDESEGQVTITNMLGSIMSVEPLNNGTFSVENIPTGIYFVRIVTTNGKILVTKLVKK